MKIQSYTSDLEIDLIQKTVWIFVWTKNNFLEGPVLFCFGIIGAKYFSVTSLTDFLSDFESSEELGVGDVLHRIVGRERALMKCY